MPSISREQTFVMDDYKKKKARKVAATTEQLLFSSEPVSDDMQLTGREEFEKDPLQFLYPQPVNAVISGTFSENKSLSYVILPAAIDKCRGSGVYDSMVNKLPDVSHSAPHVGEIMPFTQKLEMQKGSYFMCTHVAEGHTLPVRCVECTEDVLFTGSDDRSVKIWDLSCAAEIQKLDNHPSAVVKVCYSEYTRLAYTASASEIKVWDVRQKPTCIQTLWSSGQSRRGNQEWEMSAKYQSLSEEYHVNDIVLNHYGTMLFSAFTGSVRVWDLKMFQSIGSLNVGYQSNISCLAVDDLEIDKNMVVCGSKDNSIKVYEVMDDSRGVHHPKFTLAPPHYDGVRALAISGDLLFSGSDDMAIKKWDLRKRCVQHSQYRAHRDFVYAMNVLASGNVLVSGDRSGYLKLWSTDKCNALEEIRAHTSAINGITSNNSYLFTASDDCTIGIWRLSSSDTSIVSATEFQN